MTKKEMRDNIIKLFGRNHNSTYQFFSLTYCEKEEIVKFYYNRTIESEKNRVENEIKKLQKRLDYLNKM